MECLRRCRPSEVSGNALVPWCLGGSFFSSSPRLFRFPRPPVRAWQRAGNGAILAGSGVRLGSEMLIMSKKKKIAVVLSGCGVNDGSEIHEAVLTLLAIDRPGAAAVCFRSQCRPARCHRSSHRPTDAGESQCPGGIGAHRPRQDQRFGSFRPKELRRTGFPCGFGAAKNLCSFAVDGPDCRSSRR